MTRRTGRKIILMMASRIAVIYIDLGQIDLGCGRDGMRGMAIEAFDNVGRTLLVMWIIAMWIDQLTRVILEFRRHRSKFAIGTVATQANIFTRARASR